MGLSDFFNKLFGKKEEAGQQEEQAQDTQSDVSGNMGAGEETEAGAEASSEEEKQQ